MLRPIEDTMPSGDEDELAQTVTRARGGDSAAYHVSIDDLTGGRVPDVGCAILADGSNVVAIGE